MTEHKGFREGTKRDSRLRSFIEIMAIVAIFSLMAVLTEVDEINVVLLRGSTITSRNTGVLTMTSFVKEDNDNVYNDNSPVQTKPNLVFHIGPPKTGTSSIQYALHKYLRDALEQDNYYYAGKVYADVGEIPPQSALMDYTLHKLYPSTSQCRKQPTCDCVDGFKEQLEPYLESGQNVLFSAEGFIKQFGTSKHYQCLQERLGRDWNIVVIVAYRRLYDWLPSKLFQGYRMDNDNKHWKKYWPGQYGVEGPGKPGKEAELLFPRLYKEWQVEFEKNLYTTQALETIDGQVKVNILNMNSGTAPSDSLTTQFVCEVLPNAEHTCSKAHALDQTPDGMVTRNQGVSPLHIFYDLVITRAVAKGILDPSKISWTRHDVRQKVRDENERVLNQTAYDFPLECPSRDALEEFLEQSLEAEHTVFGEEQASRSEASHREAFWSNANSTTWCNVDADAVLEMEYWKEFFAKL